jgi:hypothetical protein
MFYRARQEAVLISLGTSHSLDLTGDEYPGSQGTGSGYPGSRATGRGYPGSQGTGAKHPGSRGLFDHTVSEETTHRFRILGKHLKSDRFQEFHRVDSPFLTELQSGVSNTVFTL